MLKLIGILTMLIDHIGCYFADYLPLPVFWAMRAIGRLAFPIFAFYLVQGYRRTRSLVRYFLRLVGFGIVSELVIAWVNRQNDILTENYNILFTLALSLVFIQGFQLAFYSYYSVKLRAKRQPASADYQLWYEWQKRLPLTDQIKIQLGKIDFNPNIGIPLGILMMLIVLLAECLFPTDYGIYGILLPFSLYLAEEETCRRLQAQAQEKALNSSQVELTCLQYALQYSFILTAVFLILSYLGIWLFPDVQLLAIIGVGLCYSKLRHTSWRADNERPAWWQKYFFYLFYPAHIGLIGLIHYYLIK